MEKKSHDGEERFVIDLSTLDLSASSQDAGVTVNVAGKVLPVANKEECREQETEEDSLSVAAGVTVKAKSEEDSLSTTSTIEYGSDYSEEHYPSEAEDDDDDEYSTDEEEWDVTKTRTPSIRPRRAWEDKDKWEDKDEWVASWKELCKFRQWTWIDVYAYFNKGQGGYGVILRDALAKPIVASANFSEDGKSFFYQVFMGIKAGVELAERHGRSFLHVNCNSVMVAALFCDANECFDKNCRDTSSPNYICMRCEMLFSTYIGWRRISELLVPLIVELRGKNIQVAYMCLPEASHYVAKRGKMIKRREVEKKEESRIGLDDDKPSEMKPDDFPPELINLLWEDAFSMTCEYTSIPFGRDYYAI